MDWKLLIEIVLLALTGMVCALVLPWLRERLGAEKLKTLWKWVCLCVQAAEQLFGANAGEKKKQYVRQEMKNLNLKADEQTLEVLIEAAVRELV